eukprot:5923851-Amphidinium_carterae.1
MPLGWAIAQEHAGVQKFKTASGQELEDAGGVKLRGKAESCRKGSPDDHAPHRSAHTSGVRAQSVEAKRLLSDG